MFKKNNNKKKEKTVPQRIRKVIVATRDIYPLTYVFVGMDGCVEGECGI